MAALATSMRPSRAIRAPGQALRVPATRVQRNPSLPCAKTPLDEFLLGAVLEKQGDCLGGGRSVRVVRWLVPSSSMAWQLPLKGGQQ
jgi:hypothetical protein